MKLKDNFDYDADSNISGDSSTLSPLHLRSYAIYFFMVASLGCVSALAIKNHWPYGLTTFLSLLSFQLFFIILERIIPYEKEWHPTGKEWLRDATYFGLVCCAGAYGQGLVASIATHIASTSHHLNLMLEIPLALMLSSLASYSFHLLGHVNKFFWQAHGIHHTPTKVNVANNGVTHFIDVIVRAIVSQVPLFLLNFSAESMFISLAFTAMQGYFIHANVNMKMGPLNYLIATPESHRLHHSLDLAEAQNYGTATMLWDIVFGTFTWMENRVPLGLGIQNRHEFPATAAIHKNIVHPFVFLAKSAFSAMNKQRKKLHSASDA
jgi:sterol desaturase/sphingolipid hydroxylase (fatty acid hydroxylase superfamily)